MKPSADLVLRLLRSRDGITSLDALYAGCGSRLAARVKELREAGYDIRSEWVSTDNGARIVRYVLRERPVPTTGVQQGLAL